MGSGEDSPTISLERKSEAVADNYKALTFVNLPFIEERFAPGDVIPYEKFVASAEQAAAVVDDRTDADENATAPPTADEQIEDLLEWGSISEDLDAPLHPDHLPVDPNELSVAAAVSRMKEIVDQMEAAGVDVPAKMREFAEMSEKQITEADASRRMVMSHQNGGSAENASS